MSDPQTFSEDPFARFDRFTSTAMVELTFDLSPSQARRVQAWLDQTDWDDEPQLERIGRIAGRIESRFALSLPSCRATYFRARWSCDFEIA